MQTATRDTAIIYALANNYVNALQNAVNTGNWKQADTALENIRKFQEENGQSVLVDKTKIKAEVFIQ